MTRYIIVDDEPIAHRIIEGYAKDLAQLEKVGNCYNALEALALLQGQAIDLIFLDINMPQLSGFDLLKTLPNTPKVIVTTAYQEYALEGYELEVTDYLLKPFSFERFLKAVNKVIITGPVSSKIDSAEEANQKIFIKVDKQLRQVALSHIYIIEAYGNYCKIHLMDEILITPEKISGLEEILPSNAFMRCHKSFIIASNHIKAIEGSKISILELFVPIGQTYSSTIKKALIG